MGSRFLGWGCSFQNPNPYIWTTQPAGATTGSRPPTWPALLLDGFWAALGSSLFHSPWRPYEPSPLFSTFSPSTLPSCPALGPISCFYAVWVHKFHYTCWAGRGGDLAEAHLEQIYDQDDKTTKVESLGCHCEKHWKWGGAYPASFLPGRSPLSKCELHPGCLLQEKIKTTERGNSFTFILQLQAHLCSYHSALL